MSNEKDLKSKFSDIYSDHIKNLIILDSTEKDVKGSIRLIEHLGPPLSADFLPYIIQDGDPFPSHIQQDKKTKPSSFGISFFDTVEHLVSCMKLVPATRNSSYCVSVDLKAKYGTSSNYDQIGHMNHYLFDPYSQNTYPLHYKVVPFESEGKKDEKNSSTR